MKYRKKTPPPPTYPKLSISTLVLTALCVFAIVIATFKQFHFEYINPLEFLTKSTFPHQSLTYYAQIPIVLFIGAFLGSNFGLLAILGYIFTGLFIAPVFGLGGGLNYVLQPSFGYILGYMFGVYFVGKNLENNRSPLALLLSAIIGVIVIHIFGIIYLSLISFFHHQEISIILGWIWTFSGLQLSYDIVFSICTVLLARPIRGLFAFILK